MSAMGSRDRIERALWRAVVFLALIGIAAVVRRALVLVPTLRHGYHPSANPLDAGFARHPVLTLVHIIPGFLFMVLGPPQLVGQIRSQTPWLHRWCGRVFVASGVGIGLSALAMSWQTGIGGVSETAAATLFALLFLWALGKGFLHIRRREFAQHREWMIRAFAIGLAVATIRPIIGIFFATSRLTHLTPREFFGTAFWLGFTLHLIAAEAWIHYTRPSAVGHRPSVRIPTADSQSR
jgi:uncharacterized membrane protein